MSQLPGPVLDGQRRTSVASRETESSDTAANLIGQEFQIQQETLAAGPAAQNALPTTLLLVAVGESDVDVFEGEFLLGELLQTENDSVLGGIGDPGAFGNERGTDL